MKKMNFRTKMISLMVVILLIFLSLGFLMQDTIKTSVSGITNLYNGSVITQNRLSGLKANMLSKIQIPIQEFRSTGVPEAAAAYQLRASMKDIRNQFLKIRNEGRYSSQEQALFANMAASLDKLFGTVENIIDFKGDIGKKEDHLHWQKLYYSFNRATEKFEKDSEVFLSMQTKSDKLLMAKINKSLSTKYRLNNAILILGFLIILIFSFMFIKDISKKYQMVIKYLVNLSNGDLTEDIPDIAHDELGWILRHVRILQESLRKITIEINTAVGNLSFASNDLSASSQNIAQGASEQASSVEEISSSVEEMASNIHQVADNAKAAENVVIHLSETTKQMVDATRKSQEKMEAITEKIGIISEIAFQTNILALNAAVEAARAGEHGRGFGVVAVEVGKLAERSKKASSEIESLIHSSVDVIYNAGKMMLEMAPEVTKTTSIVKSISTASVEQKLGADQINDAVQQFNEITQQNAAASEEIATSAEELSAQADRLMESQSFFKLNNRDKIAGAQKSTKPRVKKKIPQTITSGQKSKGTKGVNIDLGKPDDLDEGYERF